MSNRKIVGIDLNSNLILIHYVESDDKIIDERVAVVQWKKNPTLQRLVLAFTQASSQYILSGNNNIEKLESIDLEQLFRNLLDDDKNDIRGQ